MVSNPSGMWDGEIVRRWLNARVQAARLDQAAADKRGYDARDDYDAAAAEQWVCEALTAGGHADDQSEFAFHLKELLAQEEYVVTGVHDDRRFDRHVRTVLRKLGKMTKANTGFANTMRFQG